MQPAEQEQLCRQVEFYFSEKNITRDNVLRSLMGQGSDGYVPIKTLIKHKRVDTASIPAIIEAVRHSKVLELHPNEPKVRRIGLFSLPGREKKPKAQGPKVAVPVQGPYICNLDTSQKSIIFPASSPDKLPELPFMVLANLHNASGLAANSEVICTYQFLHDRGTLHVIQDGAISTLGGFTAPLEAMAIRPDTNVLGLSFRDGTIEAYDIDRRLAKCFSFKGLAPHEKLKWHPTVWSVFVTASGNEVTIWELGSVDTLGPRRFKTYVQTHKVLNLSFHPDQSDLLTVAMERGAVKTFNYETEEVLFEVMAHLYNLKLYGPGLSAFPITPHCLLTAGKSHNELILWNWPDPSSSHSFQLNSQIEKGVEFAFDRAVVYGVKANYCAIIGIEVVERSAKFSTVIEVALKAPALAAILRSDSELVVLHAGELLSYTLPYGKTVELEREAPEEQKVPEVLLIPEVRQDFRELSKRLDDWNSSIEKSCQELAGQIEGLFKEPDDDEALCAEVFHHTQDAVTDLLFPALDTGVSEILSQFEGCFTDGSREYWEHFMHRTNKQSWVAETQTQVTKMLGSIVSVIWKNPHSLMKEFGRQITLEEDRLKKSSCKNDLKKQIDDLMEGGQYEEALQKAMKAGVLGAVIQFLNPLPLVKGKHLSNKAARQVIESLRDLPASLSAEWVAALELQLSS